MVSGGRCWLKSDTNGLEIVGARNEPPRRSEVPKYPSRRHIGQTILFPGGHNISNRQPVARQPKLRVVSGETLPNTLKYPLPYRDWEINFRFTTIHKAPFSFCNGALHISAHAMVDFTPSCLVFSLNFVHVVTGKSEHVSDISSSPYRWNSSGAVAHANSTLCPRNNLSICRYLGAQWWSG